MSSLAHPDAIARQLAAASPTSMLPCPRCASSVRADNLEGHLAKVHAAPAPAIGRGWRGVDRRAQRDLTVVLVVCGVAGAALVGTHHDAQPLALVAGCVLGPLAVLLILAAAGVLRATLKLQADALVLRYLFGLRRRRVRLPAALESGSLTRLRPSVISEHQVDEVRAGTYLRLSDGRRHIVVASERGTGFRKHWSPRHWRGGPKRRSCDITLQLPDVVALEYQLAYRSMLSPRSDDG